MAEIIADEELNKNRELNNLFAESNLEAAQATQQQTIQTFASAGGFKSDIDLLTEKGQRKAIERQSKFAVEENILGQIYALAQGIPTSAFSKSLSMMA